MLHDAMLLSSVSTLPTIGQVSSRHGVTEGKDRTGEYDFLALYGVALKLGNLCLEIAYGLIIPGLDLGGTEDETRVAMWIEYRQTEKTFCCKVLIVTFISA
jgi:hypothetical protein